jgi:hypothetical protein
MQTESRCHRTQRELVTCVTRVVTKRRSAAPRSFEVVEGGFRLGPAETTTMAPSAMIAKVPVGKRTVSQGIRGIPARAPVARRSVTKRDLVANRSFLDDALLENQRIKSTSKTLDILGRREKFATIREHDWRNLVARSVCLHVVPAARSLTASTVCSPQYPVLALQMRLSGTSLATTLLFRLERLDVVRQILDPQFNLKLI